MGGQREQLVSIPHWEGGKSMCSIRIGVSFRVVNSQTTDNLTGSLSNVLSRLAVVVRVDGEDET